ncbi:uncharacterized protein LOC132062254 [Lycium ferocissimum]|uniref:uncharacterized protein LOC132062254 n=1 Tax=Lycium ferocissimum TaxID=112874 RepID=UPI0028157426|nr:uncharacterized protein LOC132062254 [Lycium ferocissimum]
MNLFMHNANVGLFGLLGAKVKRQTAQRAALNLCNGWAFSTNLSHHPGGRIWLVWKPMLYNVNIVLVSSQLIHCEMGHRGTNHTFWFTIVYGFNDQVLRRELWQQIEGIHGTVSGAWAIMGDFNCVLNREERVGSPMTLAEVREFKQCVGKCSFHDLKSSGAFYTWNNKHRDATRVYSKIDRVLVNSQWITNLPASEVQFSNEGHHGGKRFRYYNMWRLADNFKEIVKRDWERNISGTYMFKLVGKLNRLKAPLRALHSDKFSNVEQNAERARRALDVCQSDLQNNPTNVNLMANERRLAEDYQTWKVARGQYLQQKCKVHWLKVRDHNTKLLS